MKKVLFILIAAMLLTFSCKKEEVEEPGCYKFTTIVTYTAPNVGVEIPSNYTETQIICSIVERDAIAVMNHLNSTSEMFVYSEDSNFTYRVKVTKKTTYKKL